MKSFFAGVAAALVLAAPNLYAQDRSSQAVPVVYFSMPFGISNTQSEPTYGLKLAQVSKTRNGGINLFNNRRPAFMDFQMKGTEMNALSINGINTLQQRLVHHADGSSSTQNSLNGKYMLYGLYMILGLLTKQL